MRRGMQGLALQVQESLKRDPHAGDLYIFRGRRGDIAKILWHDAIGLSLYAKRLAYGDQGRSPSITPLGDPMLDAIVIGCGTIGSAVGAALASRGVVTGLYDIG